jgi:hypothetical protein
MDLSYITEAAWAKFQAQYPSAYAMLLAANLEQEERCLTIELESYLPNIQRRQWIIERLHQLGEFK